MISKLPPVPENDRLAAILDGYVAALEDGAAPSKEELLALHPEFAADLEECLSSLDFLRWSGLGPTGTETKPPLPAGVDPVNGVLGDFRIVRPIAHGGMGVVYEAEQISLGRRVALKVLPFATNLDAKQLRRFKNEATAAANLHHTNIVPVYAVGNDRGVHFYAMQYIDGQSLAVVIDELRRRKADKEARKDEDKETAVAASPDTPTPGGSATNGISASPCPLVSLSTQPGRKDFFRTVVQLGVQAAEALECAHDQGIVHRDIKPANLLFDVHGKLWVTDFGLAQFQSSTDLTLTGDLVGTLRYMSPEQALAKRIEVDHRTDIYSLGVTLYEMLTLERAFDGRDREELLRQIAFEEPRPPRWVCKDIPIELETVVLKAIRKNPADRYASAREMAEDLRRFLEDRPVQARRPTVVQRFASWSRRHRPVVVSAAILLVVAAVGSLASNVLILKARRVAEAERERAEDKSKLARRAVDQMYTEVAEEWLDDRPDLEPVQRRFLENALRFYQDFAQEKGEDADVRFQTANAYVRAGRIQRGFGQTAQAKTDYEQAAAILEPLVSEFPGTQKYRQALGKLLRYKSHILGTAATKEAEDLSRRAVEIARQLVAEDSGNEAYRAELAAAHLDLGRTQLRTSERRPPSPPTLVEIDKVLQEALVQFEALVEDYETEPLYRLNLAGTYYSLALVHKHGRRPRDEETAYRKAIDCVEALVAEQPKQIRPRVLLATCRQALGSALGNKDLYTEAEACLKRAGSLREQLAAEFPKVGAYRPKAAEAYRALAMLYLRQHRQADGDAAFQRALEISKTAAADFPSQLDQVFPLVGMQGEWAEILRKQKRFDEARAELDDAIPRWRKALKLDADQVCTCPLLESLYQTLARLHIDLREHSAAARIVAERLTPQPFSSFTFWDRAVLLAQCARVAASDARLPAPEQKAAARDYVEHARELVRKAAAKVGADPIFANSLAWQLTIGEEVELRDGPQAVQLAREVVKKLPKARAFWNTLGAAHYRAGQWQEAREALEKACELGKGGDGFDWFFLAMTCRQLGDIKQARQWYDKALAWADEKRSKDPTVARLRAEAAAVMEGPEAEPKGTPSPLQ